MQRPTKSDAVDLEEAFFVEESQRLLKEMRAKAQQEERREALRTVVPNADDAFLDHLIDLEIGPETALALTLVPLAAVAWADGTLDARERDALLRAAEERGVKPDTPARQLLETWLERKPDQGLIDTWKRYARALWSVLDENERRTIHDRMIGMARQVAETSGGFLGLTSKVSAAETAVLDELDRILD